ncbi:MAG: DUF6607 family protein [Pseudomonadota bacterium]
MSTSSEMSSTDATAFDRDREAILAMAGDYKVSFDFIETVALAEGYELKDRKLSGAHEVVRVIEDRGDYISLQHILVVGGEEKFPIKHWRQDWVYEPQSVLTFIGGNAWVAKDVSRSARRGAWAQEVYQVDDSPRYGAVGHWQYDDGVAAWQPAKAWRPLPRRDMTTRDDYHIMDGVNRHAITPEGWVHEQDNTKLAMVSGDPEALVREVAVNTYRHSDGFETEVADTYWDATKGYWAEVRGMWEGFEEAGEPYALTLKGEPQALYMALLTLAGEVQDGEKSEDAAIGEARGVIDEYTTLDLPPLTERLR